MNMKINRDQRGQKRQNYAVRSIKNIVIGLTGQTFTIVSGLILPRLILLKLGEEANGLIGSVSSLLGWLALLEAGVGKSARQALYKPLAEKDREGVNGILAAVSRLYKRTGIVYAAAVIGLAWLYAAAVKSKLPPQTVRWMILLAGVPGVLSYILQGTYRIFLEAEGKAYVLDGVNSLRTIGNAVGRIAVLCMGMGLLALQSVTLAITVLQIAVIVLYMRSCYPWIDLKAKPDRAAVSNHYDVLIHQITGVLFGNTDMLLLTWLCDLHTVSVYALYAMFYTMLNNILYTVSNSVTYILGRRLQEGRQYFLMVYDLYEEGYIAISCAAVCMLKMVLFPCMKLYTGGMDAASAASYLDFRLPILFTAVNLLAHGRVPAALTIELYGHFEQTKGRAVLEMVLNLVCSVIGIQMFGICGVLMGTAAALFYRSLDMIWYAGRLLERSPWITWKRWGWNVLTVLLVVCITEQMMPPPETVGKLCIWGGIVGAGTAVVFLGMNALMERKTVRYGFKLICQMIGR